MSEARARLGGARDVARRVLGRVGGDGAYAARALSAEIERASGLSDADRALATELVYGVLRERARLDTALESVADRGLARLDEAVRVALRVGAYQLLCLDRVPAHAAVDDAVNAVKSLGRPGLTGLANALLRKLAAQGKATQEAAGPDAVDDPLGWLMERRGFPRWLAELMLAELGGDEARDFARALALPAPLTLRANTLLTTPEKAAVGLLKERPGARIERSPWAPDALVARHLARLAATAAMRDGLVAVSDVGAQVVAALCDAAPGERILDACAGVGGKTGHLAALASNQARITAADVHPGKLRRAAATMAKLGVHGVDTQVVDLLRAVPWSPGSFDRVLLDAPCSGLGVLRRHPEAVARLSPDDLVGLAGQQRPMLATVSQLVRPGGLLVYAVCTFDAAETTEVVDAFVEEHAGFEVEPPAVSPLAALADSKGLVRTSPHRHDADAFFAVRLRRVR